MFIAAGCGADPCAGSPCPNDPQRTPEQYQECVNQYNANKNQPCNREQVNYQLCAQSSTVCNSGGKTDGSATLSRINTNCKAASEAVLCCSSSFFCR